MRHDRGGRRDFGSRSFAPVKVGDELDVKIDNIGDKGDGVAKKDGFVLFVPGTKKDDEVRIRVTRVLPKVGFAEVIGQKSGEESDSSEGSQEEKYEQHKEEAESSDSEEDYGGEDTENFGEDEDEKAA